MVGGVSSAVSYYGYYRYPNYTKNNAVQNSAPVQQAQETQKAQNPHGAVTMRRGADPETPVEPISRSPIVQTGTSNTIPFFREGADPVEMAVRMRIQYPEESQPEIKADAEAAQTDAKAGVEAVQDAAEEGRCETCEKRKYQDGSDDPGVSFKTPSHIAPEQAAAAVRGHEMEHVVRESAKAEREEREVVSQSVTIHTDICPECGKVYVSGGTTRTTTAAKTQPYADTYTQEEKGSLFSAAA